MSRRSRREEILDAAMACFAECGARGTSLSEIAEQAGMTHTAVRYHFPSTSELVLAVLEERDRRDREENRAFLSDDPLVLLGHLPQVARINLQQIELARLFTVLEAESLEGDSAVRAWFVRRRRALHAELVQVLRAGVKAGRVRADLDADTKATEILCFVEGAHLQHLLDPEHVDLVAACESYRDTLLNDLAREASAR